MTKLLNKGYIKLYLKLKMSRGGNADDSQNCEEYNRFYVKKRFS